MAIPSTQEILAALSGSKRTAPIAPIATPQLRPSLDTGTVSPPPQSSIPSSEEIRAVLTGESSLTKAPPAALPTPQLQQTFGERSFADYAPPNPDQVPDQIKEGLKRMALFDTNGNIVPKKLIQPFLPNTQLSTGTPSAAQKIVQALPQGVQHLAEIFLQSVREGPMESLLPTLSRDSNERVRLASGRLEDAGIDAERAASLAFYNTFSQIGSDTAQKNAARRLAALNPTPEERRILGITNLKQTGGSILDVAGIVPMGTVEKQGLARAIQLAQTMERERVLPTILEHLAAAGVEKTIAEQYAPFFAKADMPTIEKGIASLENLVSKTKATKPVAEAAHSTALTEEGARAFVKSNYEALKPAYQELIAKEYNGADNVIAADTAKKIIPGYAGELAPVYHEASSDFAKTLYSDMLEEKAGTGNNTVLFTAGATGVGKSTALRSVGVDLKQYPIVYDTNLTGEGAVTKIQQALDAGYSVDIIVTHRDPFQAFESGVIPRVQKENRVVSIAEHMARHAEFAKTDGSTPAIGSIERKFGAQIENGQVEIHHVDNSGPKGSQRLVTLDQVPNFDYTALNDRLNQVVRKSLEEGKISVQEAAAIAGKKDRTAVGERVAHGDQRSLAPGKIKINDRIPVRKTLTETAARDTTLVRRLSEEKLTGPIKDALTPHFPHLTEKTITAFSKRLAQLTRASDIEGTLSAMQRLENQANETGQRILDATMPISARSALTPRQAQLTVDQLTREIKTPENAAIAEAEYATLWDHADQRIIDRFNEANIERGILEDVITDHPAAGLAKYRLPGQSWSDMNLEESQLKGMKTGSDARHLDSHATEAGYEDLRAAQAGFEDFLSIKEQLAAVKQEIRELRPKVRSAQIVRSLLDDLPVVPNKRIAAIDELANTADIRSSYKDITGFAGGFRDMYRNFQKFFGPRWEDVKTAILDPFDAAKGDYIDYTDALGDAVGTNVIEKYGIKRGSEASAAIQDWGERDLMASPATANPDSVYHTKEALIEKFGEARAGDIMAADTWFRGEYNRVINEINDVRKQIYPNNPSKLVPFRKDYYRHYQELGNSIMDAVKNFMDVPAGIDPSLIGISEFTRPKSKWLSFAQLREGPRSRRDAIGGFLDYAPSAAYAVHIDPHIGVFRYLRRKLAEKAPISGTQKHGLEYGVKNVGIDNFLQFLDDFSNNLATKTNPVDRWIQKRIPGGRAAIKGIDWMNNRIKANTILGNVGSTLSQLANIPQGVASAKQYSIPGARRTLASLFAHNGPAAQSVFLKERYHKPLRDRFPRDFWSKPLKAGTEKASRVAADLMKFGDMVGTHFIWNSHYAKALSQGKADPVKYADDITRKLVAGRGIGELPIDQQAKITQMIAPFTVEVQNLWWVMQDQVKAKDFAGLAALVFANYLFNEVSERTRGNRVVYDPINAMVEGAATLQQEVNAGNTKEGLLEFGGRQLGEVLSNVPGGQVATSILPDEMFGIKKKNVFGQGDPNRFGPPILFAGAFKDFGTFATRLGTPFGGAQLKKTWDGINTLMQGEKSSGGKTTFPIAWTPANFARGILFGPSATSEGHANYQAADDISARISAQKAGSKVIADQAQIEWQRLKDLRLSDGPEAAAAEWARLKNDDPQIFTKVKELAADEGKQMTQADRLILQLGVANGARARYIVDQIESLKTKEERQQLWIEYTKKKILTPDVAKQAEDLLNAELQK